MRKRTAELAAYRYSQCAVLLANELLVLSCVVQTALDEAQDISLYLKPLKQLLDQTELVEFQYMAQHLPPLMHVVCLTWSHSRYYCKPGRVVVLLQEICNLLIEKVRGQLSLTG